MDIHIYNINVYALIPHPNTHVHTLGWFTLISRNH
jgi:desulfoferrodoxin (superoxide reductase-like protein)